MTINEELAGQLARQSGWCGVEKGLMLYQYVVETKPKLAVDVGVFSGKSTFSLAYGMRDNNSGLVVAVDSWSQPDCVVDSDAPTVQWWSENVNLENVYLEFLTHLTTTGLAKWIRILRMTSYQAAMIIDEPIQVLHIDGNHAEWSSTSDVALWLPKLAINGILCMDDFDWQSTQIAVGFVKKFCEEIAVVKTSESNSAFYRKIR